MPIGSRDAARGAAGSAMSHSSTSPPLFVGRRGECSGLVHRDPGVVVDPMLDRGPRPQRHLRAVERPHVEGGVGADRREDAPRRVGGDAADGAAAVGNRAVGQRPDVDGAVGAAGHHAVAGRREDGGEGAHRALFGGLQGPLHRRRGAVGGVPHPDHAVGACRGDLRSGGIEADGPGTGGRVGQRRAQRARRAGGGDIPQLCVGAVSGDGQRPAVRAERHRVGDAGESRQRFAHGHGLFAGRPQSYRAVVAPRSRAGGRRG